jgi:hypothetical protein
VFAVGLLRLGRSARRVVALQLVSPEELEPDLEGEVELMDSETGESRAGWIGSAQRAAFGSALANLTAQVSGVCRDAGIRHVRLSTGTPIEQCVQRTLVQAGLLYRERS